MKRLDDLVSEAAAEELAAKIMAAAGDVARQEAVFLELVGEFDAIGAVAWWTGIQSTAHWLSWACSIASGTAREHVRVARALRRMPATRQAFALGQLTYSKVREVTRVADELDRAERVKGQQPDRSDAAEPGQSEHPQQSEHPEQSEQSGESEQSAPSDKSELPAGSGLNDLNEVGLVELARACTASQLARTVSGWRAARGTSKQRRLRQRVAWVTQEDGSVYFTAVLPPEQGAALIKAVQAATEANTDPEPVPGQQVAEDQASERDREERVQQTRVDALTEIANHYLASRPEDRSGEDRTMVVIEVNAAALAADPRESDAEPPERSRGNAAGDPIVVPTCRVRDGAAIEPSDARRALCDSTILGVIVDHHGMPLAVGREERLITKHQRRALMMRDGCCQFPGCARTRHLKAHHRTSWLAGGNTDIENLILLCQSHHTRVHEDRLSITACEQPGCGIPWRFIRPDGSTIAPTIAGLNDQWVTDYQTLADQAARLRTAYQHVHDAKHPDAATVYPVGGGEGFQLVSCVDALFALTQRPPTPSPRAA